MHIKLFVTIMIAALMWTGNPTAAIAPIAPREQTTSISPAVRSEIPETQAIDTALTHAGLTEAEVTSLRVEFELDDGRPEYEVEFRHGNWEYDYTIHAETGAILKHDKEYDPPKVPTPDKPRETVPPETTPAKREQISAERAKSIALKHAGLTAGEVTGLRIELDRDDGRPEYEIEFRVGRWEYSYEIHAETGKILDWEKDYDD